MGVYQPIKSILFQMDAERAHTLTLSALSKAPWLGAVLAKPVRRAQSTRQTLWGMTFDHPVGLAAGLDKNAEAVDGLFACGFSFIEVGTVTPRPQPGNDKPRLFRLPPDEALINRMGFNNHGAHAMQANLERQKRRGMVGINLGKNKTTPNEQAVDDYTSALRVLYPLANFIVINVSSPNTPGLRDLQSVDSLSDLVCAVRQCRDDLAAQASNGGKPRPPILVKLAPDLHDDDLTTLGRALPKAGVDGFVATNTTISRPNLQSSATRETGGLSGRPLKSRSTEVIRQLFRATEGSIPIVGCGGIFTANDAYEKVRAGARLIELYTGFIYNGPQAVADVANGLVSLLERDGFSHLTDAVGTDA